MVRASARPGRGGPPVTTATVPSAASLLDGAASQSELAALDVKVGNLDGDIREINDRLLGLDTKIDKAITSLATEFRSALSSLATQLSERNKTPWAVLISAAAFLVTVLGGIGWQALSPVREEVNDLRSKLVPRAEVEFRHSVNEKRLNQIEADLRDGQRRREDQMQRTIDRLEQQLRAH